MFKKLAFFAFLLSFSLPVFADVNDDGRGTHIGSGGGGGVDSSGVVSHDLEMGNTPYSIDGGTGGLAFDPDNDNTNEITFGTDGTITQTSTDNPSIVFNVLTAGDTDYWLGVRNDAGGADNDTFQIGDGTTPGTNPWITLETDGDIGIGDTSPDSELELEKNQDSDTTVFITNTTAGISARSGIRFQSDTANGDVYAASGSFSSSINIADRLVIVANSTASGLTISTTAAAPIQFYTNSTLRETITSTGRVNIGTNESSAAIFTVDPPSVQTIAAGNTVTANACGTIKPIMAAGNVTTDTTNTLTAPAASVVGCIMKVVNVGSANTITLDNNANFMTNLGADIALGPGDAVIVGSVAATSPWYQLADISVNS